MTDDTKAGEESELKPSIDTERHRYLDHCECYFRMQEAHKQIAALEARNAELKESFATEITMHSIAKDNIAALEKRNADMVRHCETYHKELAKRNAKLEKEAQMMTKWVDGFGKVKSEFEAKLKTAEDALAAVTKEKEALSQRNQILEESKTTQAMLDDVKKLFQEQKARADWNREHGIAILVEHSTLSFSEAEEYFDTGKVSVKEKKKHS